MQIIFSEPTLFDIHHERKPYYKHPPLLDERIAYAACLLRYSRVKFLEEFNPDFVFCVMNNYLVKQSFRYYQRRYNYKYRCFHPSRLNDLWNIYDHDLNILRCRLEVSVPLSYKSSVNSYQTYDSPHRKTIESLNRFSASLFKQYVSYIISLLGEVSITIISILINLRNRLIGKSITVRYFDTKTNLLVAYYIKRLLSITYFFACKDDLFIQSQPNNLLRLKRIVFPLHVLPESSTPSLSNQFFELDLIRLISLSLPANMKLFVKENITKIGHRSVNYYSQLLNIPNVALLDPFETSSITLKNNDAFIGISGTMLLEALLCNKPSFSFGLPEYLQIYRELDLPHWLRTFEIFINDLTSGKYNNYNFEQMAKSSQYLQTVYRDGFLVDNPLKNYMLYGLNEDLVDKSAQLLIHSLNQIFSDHKINPITD